MFLVTALVVGYAHLDFVGVYGWTLESSREDLLVCLSKSNGKQ